MGELYAEVLEARNLFQWATASIRLLTYDDMDIDAIQYEEMRGVYDMIKGLFASIHQADGLTSIWRSCRNWR